jgi:hypothetical protein
MGTFSNYKPKNRSYSNNDRYAIASGIRASSAELGVNPHDLATIISYETAGTFNPSKRGPITRYGQHQGLIQFGELQAKQYGVNFNNPINSQLGKNGAIVKYMRHAGVKPGMGLLDMYSAVNAGHVGMNNASDAQNGGAPGTVADKVNYQMEGHKKNATKLLGTDSSGSVDNSGIDSSAYERNFMGKRLDYSVPNSSKTTNSNPAYKINDNPNNQNGHVRLNMFNNGTSDAIGSIVTGLADLTTNQLNSSLNSSHFTPASLFPINFGPNTPGEFGVT